MRLWKLSPSCGKDQQSRFLYRDGGITGRGGGPGAVTTWRQAVTFCAAPMQGLPEADLPTMSTPWILHCLYSLNPSSPDFSHRLRSLIWHDEREQFLTSLQGPQLARLVDFLDQVRALPSAFCLTTNRIP